MNFDQLEGKILASKDSRKIGRIVQVRKSLPVAAKSDDIKVTIIIIGNDIYKG